MIEKTILEKSAESIKRHLSSVSDEDFLSAYRATASNKGVTVDEFLRKGNHLKIK